MTIHTHRHRMVARLLPRVVLWLHDVAIDTDFGVIAHVGKPFRVKKGESADAQ